MAEAERVFDVEITIRRVVRVRVPDELLNHPPGGTHEDAAEEFALAGKRGWPQYIISSEEDYDVDSIKEVVPAPDRSNADGQ